MNRYKKHLEDERISADTTLIKGGKTNVESLQTPHTMAHPLDWEWQDNKGVPRKHNLEEFRDGSITTGILGNPPLIHDLAPYIRAHLFGKSPGTHKLRLYALREFWRFCADTKNRQRKIFVHTLKDIDEDFAKSYYNALRYAVFNGTSTEDRGIFLWGVFCRLMSHAQCNICTWPEWRPSRRTMIHKDVPPRAVKHLYEAAKRVLSEGRVRHSVGQVILSRFQEASSLIELTGAHLPGANHPFGAEWSEPNNILFSVYCRFQARLKGAINSNITPAIDSGINKAIKKISSIDGILGADTWTKQSDLWHFFAPTSIETVAALMLVTAETGWIDTARAIDVSSDEWFKEGRHQTLRKRNGRTVEIIEMIISSSGVDEKVNTSAEVEISAIRPKTRRQHQTRSLMQSDKGFRSFAVIKYMVTRTRLLREIVMTELTTLRQIPRPSTDHLRRIAELDEQARCPWLFFPANMKEGPKGLTPSGAESVKKPFNILKEIAIIEAVRTGETQEIIEEISSLTPSDFRDAYAAWIYSRTGNDIFAVQAALNHRGINTTRRYLRQRSQIRERFASCARVMEAGFDEAQTNCVIDPTILRLAADRTGHGVTKEDRAFLAEFRSACGARCADPTNPPEEIESASERVKHELCSSQRCGLCRHARFDSASLHGVAVRIAELKALNAVTPAERWLLSIYPVELEALELLVEGKFADHAARVWAWVREHRKSLKRGDILVFGTMSVDQASALIGIKKPRTPNEQF